MNSDLLLAYEAISRLSHEWQPARHQDATSEPGARRTRRRLFPTLRAAATGVSRKESER
jgi:hypothetical protein